MAGALLATSLPASAEDNNDNLGGEEIHYDAHNNIVDDSAAIAPSTDVNRLTINPDGSIGTIYQDTDKQNNPICYKTNGGHITVTNSSTGESLTFPDSSHSIFMNPQQTITHYNDGGKKMVQSQANATSASIQQAILQGCNGDAA